MAKQKQFDYDLIIIGSGAGGSVAAHIANRAGLNVAQMVLAAPVATRLRAAGEAAA